MCWLGAAGSFPFGSHRPRSFDAPCRMSPLRRAASWQQNHPSSHKNAFHEPCIRRQEDGNLRCPGMIPGDAPSVDEMYSSASTPMQPSACDPPTLTPTPSITHVFSWPSCSNDVPNSCQCLGIGERVQLQRTWCCKYDCVCLVSPAPLPCNIGGRPREATDMVLSSEGPGCKLQGLRSRQANTI